VAELVVKQEILKTAITIQRGFDVLVHAAFLEDFELVVAILTEDCTLVGE